MKTLCGKAITIRPHRGLLKNSMEVWEVDIDNHRWRLQDAVELATHHKAFGIYELNEETANELRLTCECYIEAYYTKWYVVPKIHIKK